MHRSYYILKEAKDIVGIQSHQVSKMAESKDIQTKLKGILSKRFELIKAELGLEDDAEVLRYLIQYYFKEELESMEKEGKAEVKGDRKKIKKFMKEYGEEWEKLGE